MDILIARLLYPNDVTRTIIPHQNYVALLSNDHIELYSVSSIPGKELRIKDEKTKHHYEIIKADEIADNGFAQPSFIDCSKMYLIPIDDTVDLNRLSHRSITNDLKNRFDKRIDMLKCIGEHSVYSILLDDFKRWNLKAKK